MKSPVSLSIPSMLCAAFFSFSAQSAEVVGAQLRGSVVEIQVRYSGGCKKHEFKVETGGCLESFPVQCHATVTDLTKGDNCEALASDVYKWDVSKMVRDTYFQGAHITIKGSNGSKAYVRLPGGPSPGVRRFMQK